jgi:hypothetical protein
VVLGVFIGAKKCQGAKMYSSSGRVDKRFRSAVVADGWLVAVHARYVLTYEYYVPLPF